jgi:hypothetical protein
MKDKSQSSTILAALRCSGFTDGCKVRLGRAASGGNSSLMVGCGYYTETKEVWNWNGRGKMQEGNV